ncbi:MAG: hypothetical protein LBE80_06145, partial [Deltaproteobacteria bacterium]|nr:hypothetical protein [Deltaproteobacteria bacterium]
MNSNPGAIDSSNRVKTAQLNQLVKLPEKVNQSSQEKLPKKVKLAAKAKTSRSYLLNFLAVLLLFVVISGCRDSYVDDLLPQVASQINLNSFLKVLRPQAKPRQAKAQNPDQAGSSELASGQSSAAPTDPEPDPASAQAPGPNQAPSHEPSQALGLATGQDQAYDSSLTVLTSPAILSANSESDLLLTFLKNSEPLAGAMLSFDQSAHWPNLRSSPRRLDQNGQIALKGLMTMGPGLIPLTGQVSGQTFAIPLELRARIYSLKVTTLTA